MIEKTEIEDVAFDYFFYLQYIFFLEKNELPFHGQLFSSSPQFRLHVPELNFFLSELKAEKGRIIPLRKV